MKHIRIPIPAIRWLTISWGEDTQAQTQHSSQPTEPATAPAPRRYGHRGKYSLWLKETGKHRKAWERYYQIDRTQMDYLMMRTGHKAPFSQQEIVDNGHIFARYLDQRTDPDTQGLGRPRLRSV